jgi:hypothetical protein
MATCVATEAPQQMLNVIKGEYSEMPGMRLTRAQFRRLWQLDEIACDRAIALLMRDGFLDEDAKGQLHRAVDACV